MSVFRKKALKKMSSPDGLDKAIEAAPPQYWISFLAAFGIVALAVVWGVLGSIPTRVTADGILLNRGSEVFTATAESSGRLVDIVAEYGAHVEQGDILAVINQNLDQSRLVRAEETLEQYQKRKEIIIEERDADLAQRRALNKLRAQTLREKIANGDQRIKILNARVSGLNELLKDGYTNRETVLQAEYELVQVNENQSDMQNELVNLDVALADREEKWRDRLRNVDREIFEQRGRIAELEDQIEVSNYVRAPVSGTVTEISASQGDVLSAGTPVVRVISEANQLDALLFVSPTLGKRVHPGSVAHVEPGVVKKEEYGTINAVVRSISDLPLSRAAIKAMLHNDRLVEQFTRDGAPIVIRADLRENGENVSGLNWSGGHGPSFEIEPGTLTAATITIEERRPATLILPFLKSVIGMGS